MLSTRCYSAASIFAALFLSFNALAQAPGSTPAADYFVHHKHASVTQSANQNFGSAVAISGDVLLSADPDENIEILRKQGDGSWAYEASLTSPDADIAFGQRHALATNGDWIAVGAKLDDTFGLNSGAVHMYKFDGADWEYRGALSHMAPHGSIVTDQFGMALAMDGDRMVVGSRAENGVGAAGAVHYFTYNTWLDMWLETGFIASEHTEGNSTSKYGESVDISGDWMIVGEHRNNTNGQYAGAAHIYQFYNQCWHHAETFYGDAEWNWLGYDVAISGTNAVAGAPYADTDGLNEAGAAKLYQLLPFSGTESFWTETFDVTAPIPVQGDWFGLSIDIDEDLLLVGAPRDDDDVINGGVGYFMFDCTTDNFDCVAEGLACDAMQNDRLGMDVALSNGLAVIGAPLDDNIFTDAGSAYVLGANDVGFACDLTAPGAPMVDLVDENDSGADNEDNLTRHTSPDFDVFLPGGGTMALMSGVTAQAGDVLVWTLDGTTESEMVFLTQDDIDNGYVTMQFIYPGPVLPDGVYTYCAYIIDVFGNIGATDCLTITIDNEDPEPSFAGGAEYDTSNTDDYGAFLPGAMSPEECEELAAAAGGTWDGTFTDAGTLMVSPGCYNVGAGTYEWQTYATFLPDTTLYLDASGNVTLDLSSADNITATDNIAIDTVYADLTDFDCDDAGMTLPVTVTAVDMAGNLGTITVQVEILDEVAPEALAQDLTVQLDATGAGSITAEDIDNGSNDACGIQSLALDVTSFDCADVGANTVTLTVTDNNGNVSTATATVTVEDNVAPTVVTQNITVQLDASGAGSITTADIDNGSSDACGIQTMALDITSFGCANVGANTVTLTVTDNNGNSASATATVTVEDNVAPTAIAQNLTVELDASGAASITADEVDNGSSDACGIASLSLSQTAFDCDDQGDNTVTLTVTDNNGNVSTATATITVLDLVDPTAAAQDITVQLDATGNASITAAQIDNGSDDTCGGIASMTVSPDNFDCDDLGDNTVTLTVFDGSGNSATATATVTVEDNEAPALSGMPANITQASDAGDCSAAVSWTAPTASDNCSATITSSHASGDTFAVGTTTVTYTATDAAGNTDSASFTVTVTDDEAPAISGMPADITQTADAGSCGAAVSWIASAAPIALSASSLIDAGPNGNWPHVVTLTTSADPTSGNQQTLEINVTSLPSGGANYRVVKTVANGNWFQANPQPLSLGMNTITVSGVSFQRSVKVQFSDGDVEFDALAINGEEQTSASLSTGTSDLFAPGPNATWTHVYTATTAADPNSGDQQVVEINVTALPSGGANYRVAKTVANGNWFFGNAQALSLGSNTITVSGVAFQRTVKIQMSSGDIEFDSLVLNGEEQVSDGAPTASDNCAVASLTSTHDSGDTFPVGTTTVTYTATDIHGNTTTSSFTVTVTDDEDPTISGTPADITQTADAGDCSAVVSWTEPTASDNCAVDTFTSSHSPGDTFAVGATTVTYTATDIHGNQSTSSFTVTVTDDEAPVISGTPANISQDSDPGSCTATVTWTAPTAADNCALASLTSTHDSGDSFFIGTTTVTYTATDIHGNISTSSFTVTINEVEAPVISGMPADINQTADAGLCSAAVTWTEPTASDNCNVASFTSTHNSGDAFAVGTTTVTYTAVDNAGNSTSASFNVTVTDDEAPSTSGTPADITQTNDAGNCSAVASWTQPTAADNCAIATFTSTHSPGDAFAVGTTTVTYTATDIHGNSSTASFDITVTDDEDPSISGMPSDITQTADAGLCSAVITWADPSAADNCAVATFTSSHSSGDAFAVGTTTVSYTATDIHGNTTTSTFDVTVTDDEDPAISGMPADISQTNDAGECMAAVTWTEPTAADNCAIATFTSSHNPGDEFPVGTTTVTYTATDIHGNSSSDSFDIEVTDDEAPTISGLPADISQSNDAGECAADVSWTAPTAGDNCAVASFTSTHDSGDTFAVGTTTVTYSVTDIHGNSTSSSFTVTVTDDENPAISPMAADETYQRDGGEAAAFAAWLASYGGAAATDNCGIDSWSDDSTGLSDDCGSTGTETVTFTVTDIHGNSSATTATFTVIDDHAPSCPLIDLTDGSDTGLSNSDNITNDDTPTVHVVFTGSGVESAEAGDIVELYIDGTLSQTHTVTQTDVDNGYAAFETGPLADGAVGFSALHIDDCGQSSIFAFLNIIVHSTNPSAAGADMTVVLDEDGNASIEDEDLDDGSEDDFNVIDLMASQTDFDCSDVGDNTVTLTVTDIAGNTATTTVTVTVVDDIAPTLELVPLPGSQDPVEVTFTFTTDAYGAAEASATIYDSEGAVVEDYPLGSFPNSGVTDETVDLDPGTYTIVLGDDWGDGWSWAPATGEDALVISEGATGSLDFLDGTSASLEFTVAGDGAAPGGITVELGADGTVSVAAEDLVMSASDNCGIAGMSLDITGFDCDDLGDNAVVVTVTDVNGNATTASATVTVEDNLGPVVEVETGSGTAGPVDVTFTFTTDTYGAAEAFATLYDSDGATVADYPLGSFSNSAVSEETVSLDPGTYTIVLGDDWGDGWSWAPATGLDVLVLSGGASGSLDFVDGYSASLEFTVEGEAPTGPGGITVELGPDGTVSIEPGDVLVSATDNCGVDGMSLDISDFDCDDLGNNAVVLTVTDVNGNSTSETAYVTVEDNEAPVVNIFDLEAYTLYAGETCVNEVDLFAAGQPWYEATDNCGADVEIVYDVINETGVAGCREFDRRWIIHAVDASGNTDSDTTLQHITVLDDTAPMVFFDNVPEDLTIELGADCTADIPAAGTPLDSVAVTFTYTIDQYAAEAQMTVLDSEGEVIEFIDLVTDGSSTYPYDLYYTNGSDGSGGYILIQTLNLAPGDYSFLLYDDWGDGWVWNAVDGTDALVLSGGASGSWDFSTGNELTGAFTVEDAVAFDMTASATDNCTAMPELGDITYVDSAPQALCEDAGSYTIMRTFMATATDECGNETVGEYVQTLTFLDVTAPQITDSEGIDNGETISETDADDIFAFISVPSPIDLDAADACGGDVTIVETESFSGFVPTDDIGNYCGAATPAAFLDGEACDGSAPAAIVLEGAYFGGEAFTIADGGVNIVESFYDQTLHIEVEVTNADGTGGFIWSADYNEAFNWNQWSALGRGYKKDCGNVLPGTSPWTGWDYFVMQTGGMIGTGIYAGSELSLTHQPMNYYYGLQVGQGANNQNAKYGASAWFYWSGELLVNGASQGSVASSGDIMLDLDCTMPWSAEYAYTVSDACGNTTTFSYTVEGDEANAGGAYVSGEESGHQPFDISVIGDLKDPIRVTGLMPNPTNDVSQLGFVVSHNMRLRVDLYTMAGELVQELYDGNAMTDVEYLMNVDANGLEAGMYQIRISSSTYMAVKKLLVTQ